jgi:ribosomal protein S27AE
VRRTRAAQHSGCISRIEEREPESVYSSSVGKEVVDESRKCPMCGHTTWVLLDGHSTLQALEGGLEALAYSCEKCGFIRWHRLDMTKPSA